jgi:predicted RNA-binding Zn-ribbon protein involved in translation (DUF1610 family)
MNSAADNMLDALRQRARADVDTIVDYGRAPSTGSAAIPNAESSAGLDGVELLCPTCGTRVPCPNIQGDATRVICPECGWPFGAIIGARVVSLVRAPLAYHFDLEQFSAIGDTRTGRRNLQFVGPSGVLINEGDHVSLVYDRFGSLHSISNDSTRERWLVERKSVPLGALRVVAGLVLFGFVFFGSLQYKVIPLSLFCAVAVPFSVALARVKLRRVPRWFLASLFSAGAATCVLAFVRRAQGRVTQLPGKVRKEIIEYRELHARTDVHRVAGFYSDSDSFDDDYGSFE